MYDHDLTLKTRHLATNEIIKRYRDEYKEILAELKATSPKNYTSLARTRIKNNHLEEWRAEQESQAESAGIGTARRRKERSLERHRERVRKLEQELGITNA